MESRVETGDLPDSRKPIAQRLDQRNLPRQMRQIQRLHPFQPSAISSRRHKLMIHQMHPAVNDADGRRRGFDRILRDLPVDPIDDLPGGAR